MSCVSGVVCVCLVGYLDDVFLGGGDGRGDGVVHPAVTQQRTHPLQDRLATSREHKGEGR